MVGIFLKLGNVGKVVLAVLGAFGASVLEIFPLLMIVGNPASNLSDDAQGKVNLIMLIIALVPAVIVGIWMRFKHFSESKYMSLSSFAGLTANCFNICFYGTILIWIIASIMRKNNFYGFAGGMPITFIISCVVWFFSTRSYARIALSDNSRHGGSN